MIYLLFYLPAPAIGQSEPLRIVISGIEGMLLDNVEAALVLPPGLVRNGRVDERWLERFRRQAPERARQALQPFGYYEAEVETRLIDEPDGSKQLRVNVRPGEPVRVAAVQVALAGAGEGRSALREEVSRFPLQTGDILRQDLYMEAKEALVERAIDLGYLDADFDTQVIRISRQQRQAEIELLLDTGPLYHFGEVSLSGAPEYPDKFLRRYLAFDYDEIFSFAKLGQTQINFLDSDRFREVVLNPRLESAVEYRVPVDVELVPALPKRLRPGIGYGTDTGARLTLDYRDLNIRQRGHEFDAELLVAQLKQSLGAAYIVPSSRNADSQTTFRLGYDREDIDTYDRQSLFAEVERARAFSRGRRGALYLRLLQEDYTIGDEEEATSRLVLPGVRFARRRYLDPVRPREGYHFNLEARGTHQALGSDTGLLQILAAGNLLLPMPQRFSIFLRVQGGVTWQNEPLAEIPASLRFFAGGDRSIRGYAYQSVGVEDSNGDTVGGKNLLVGSIEVERAIMDNWGVAVFYDAGDAFNNMSQIDWRQGAGFGVRWYTPVGPLKFDLARQMQEPDPSWRLHLSVGFGW